MARTISLGLLLSLCLAAHATSNSPIRLELALGPEIGLEDTLRGARLEADADFFMGEIGGGLSLGARYDAGLGFFSGLAAIRLAIGSDLVIGLGTELALGEPSLLEARSGRRFSLECAALLCSLSMEAVLFEISRGGGDRPRISLVGAFSWTAYRVVVEEGENLEAGVVDELEGLLGFSAGFRALLGLRLSWD